MVKQDDSYSPKSLSLLFLLLVSSILIVLSSAMADTELVAPTSTEEKIYLWEMRHVTIINDLQNGVILRIHCKSKDDDFGIHNLPFQNSFHWKFRSNPLTFDTLFYCYMWWGNKGGSFDAYRATRDDSKCTDCKWSIRTDAVYWFNPHTNSWDRKYGKDIVTISLYPKNVILEFYLSFIHFSFCICSTFILNRPKYIVS